MNQSFEFDPNQVLEVRSGASLEEVREAYRAKSRKHHPDHGGDDWAFRLITRAYEALGQARVAGYFHPAQAPESRASSPPPRPPSEPDGEPSSVRRGLRDQVAAPHLWVDVESLILRHELDNPYELISTPGRDRNLSCSLNIAWPSTLGDDALDALKPGEAASIRDRLAEALAAATARVAPLAARHQVEDGRLRGLMSFSSARETSDAFLALRTALHDRGLGANQWTREIVIPRDHGSGPGA